MSLIRSVVSFIGTFVIARVRAAAALTQSFTDYRDIGSTCTIRKFIKNSDGLTWLGLFEVWPIFPKTIPLKRPSIQCLLHITPKSSFYPGKTSRKSKKRGKSRFYLIIVAS